MYSTRYVTSYSMLDVYAGSIIVVNFNGAISACKYTLTCTSILAILAVVMQLYYYCNKTIHTL